MSKDFWKFLNTPALESCIDEFNITILKWHLRFENPLRNFGFCSIPHTQHRRLLFSIFFVGAVMVVWTLGCCHNSKTVTKFTWRYQSNKPIKSKLTYRYSSNQPKGLRLIDWFCTFSAQLPYGYNSRVDANNDSTWRDNTAWIISKELFLLWMLASSSSDRLYSTCILDGWLIDFLSEKNDTSKNEPSIVYQKPKLSIMFQNEDRNWLTLLMQNELELTVQGPCWVIWLKFADTLILYIIG